MDDKQIEEYIQNWEKEQDAKHIEWLSTHCVKGWTLEHLSVEDATVFYNDFVKKKMLYHYPEDCETIDIIVDTYNYLNRFK